MVRTVGLLATHAFGAARVSTTMCGQHRYIPVQPLGVHPGSKNDCFATSDNSPNNPANQHPIREVRLGDQSWEEMMTGLFEIAFDTQRSATEVIRFPQLKLVAAQQRPRHNRGLKRL
jgi:hypothetical protein